jgi:uncharacterized membrane protein
LEALKNLARRINLDGDKGYAVSVLIALIVVSVFVGGYYVLLKPPEKGYMIISLLDSQKQAVDYPELLVINQNNTFNVFVEVENHMNTSQNCTVLLKTTDEMIHKLPFTADANATYTNILERGDAWEIPSTITINKPGNYSVIFELWLNDAAGEIQFSENACILNVEVIN